MDIVEELRAFKGLKAAEDGFIGDRTIVDVLEAAAVEIERLRSLAGPVTTTPTASEIYQGLRHSSPGADPDGA